MKKNEKEGASAGISVIGGIAQASLSTRYACLITDMEVWAYDATPGGSTSITDSKTYSAIRYSATLPDDDWTSGYKYDGYMPWDTNQVSAWMYNDFLPGLPYNGVESYTRY